MVSIFIFFLFLIVLFSQCSYTQSKIKNEYNQNTFIIEREKPSLLFANTYYRNHNEHHMFEICVPARHKKTFEKK